MPTCRCNIRADIYLKAVGGYWLFLNLFSVLQSYCFYTSSDQQEMSVFMVYLCAYPGSTRKLLVQTIMQEMGTCMLYVSPVK